MITKILLLIWVLLGTFAFLSFVWFTYRNLVKLGATKNFFHHIITMLFAVPPIDLIAIFIMSFFMGPFAIGMFRKAAKAAADEIDEFNKD